MSAMASTSAGTGGCAAPVTEALTADAGSAFLADLVGQIRAADSYGRLDAVDDGRLLAPYLVQAAAVGEIPLMCVVDPAAANRVRAFFRAVATGVERATGTVTNHVIDLDGEGFGRAVVFVGRLIVLCEVLRDVNAFGFRTTGQLAGYGATLIHAAVRAAEAHPEVTHVEP